MVENLYTKYIGSAKTALLLPREELRGFIKRYFFYEINSRILNHPWNPVSNGEIELFIHFDGSHISIVQDGTAVDLWCFIKGIYELGHHSWVIPQTNQNNIYKGVAVALTLSGLNQFREITLCDLLNKTIDTSEFMKLHFASLISACEGKNFFEIKKILDDRFLVFFNRAMKSRIIPLDEIHLNCAHAGIPIHVDEVARKFNVSYRSLNRYFHQHLGISPKFYLRVVRFDKMCRYLHHLNEEIDWMDIIHYCGYYDQSHFIKEFKNVIHMTPTAFVRHSQRKFYLEMAFLFE